MTQILIALLGTIVLACYGWGMYIYRGHKRKLIRMSSPITDKVESSPIVDNPSKIKRYQNSCGETGKISGINGR